MDQRLEPIPTPHAHRWRTIRLQVLPVLVFIVGLVAAAIIWTRWVAPPTLVGEVEVIRGQVRSPQSGRISELKAEKLQTVKAGQTLGYVLPQEPSVLHASVVAFRAQIEVMRTTRDPVVGQQRAALDLEQVQLDWMRQRVELAGLRGQLQQAESTLARSVNLQQQKMISDEQYDSAKNTRDSLASQAKAQAELIEQMEPRLRALSALYAPDGPTPAQGLHAAIQQKEAELKLLEAQLAPVPLVAPIDGVVTIVYRRVSEVTVAGEPIIEITAGGTDTIVGYVRQPLAVAPKPGMTVEVRTRTFHRQSGGASIIQVGQHFEPITPTLLAAMRLPATPTPTEYGLRVHISKPEGLGLMPGEHVDLIIRQ